MVWNACDGMGGYWTHQRLLDEAKGVFAATEPLPLLAQREQASVVFLGHAGHHCHRRGVLLAVQPVEEVLARLQVADETVEHGAPLVREHGGGQVLACHLIH